MAFSRLEQDERVGMMTRLLGLYEEHRKFINYAFIGAFASAIDVGVFMILFNIVETSALVAHSVSVPTAVLVSFFINARHNFKTNDYMVLRLISFALVCAFGYLVGYGVIEAVVYSGFNPNIGKIVSLPFVFAVQFLLNSKITFRSAVS